MGRQSTGRKIQAQCSEVSGTRASEQSQEESTLCLVPETTLSLVHLLLTKVRPGEIKIPFSLRRDGEERIYLMLDRS